MSTPETTATATAPEGEATETAPEHTQEHTVSHQLSGREPEKLTRVVCIGLDPSEHGRYAFDWAMQNFIRPETDLVILLHARNPLAVPAPYGAGYMDFSDYAVALERSHRDYSHAFLREYASKLLEKNISVKAIALRGDPREELVRKSNEVRADVLILGSRGLGMLKRTFLGSVSDYCAHNCTMPVIIAKMPSTRSSP